MKKHRKLTALTKDELIWIINYMSEINGEHALQRAIIALESKKENDQIEEADKNLDLAYQKRTEWLKLLAPYQGKPITEIPYNIILKADQLQKETQAAAQKYDSLTKGRQ